MAHLKRAIGFFGLVAAGVGIILGAGIYALVGKGADAYVYDNDYKTCSCWKDDEIIKTAVLS